MSCGDTIVNSVPRKAPADSHRLPAPVPLKKGGLAFTDEDEEVLVLFASQAATAIANARTHRDEQRSRADLPVIFISAYGRDETIARALERGAVDYIVKPFSVTELTARVRAALRRRTEMEPFALGDLAIRYETG